jgi:ML domain
MHLSYRSHRSCSHFQEGAYADVTVKLGVVKLLSKEFDLCEEAYVFLVLPVFAIPTGISSRRNAELEVQCPVKEGDYLVEHTVALPKEIPKGELSSFSSMLLISFI